MLRLQSTDLTKARPDALIIAVCEDCELNGSKAVRELAARAKRLKEFKGARDDMILIHDPAQVRAQRALLLGVGRQEQLNAETFRAMAGRAAGRCIQLDLDSVLFAVPDSKNLNLDPAALLEAMLEGAMLGNHVDERYKQDSPRKPLGRIAMRVSRAARRRYAGLAEQVRIACQGTLWAREWVNTPANDKTPGLLAKAISARARPTRVRVRQLDESSLRRNKMGAILAVAEGSRNRPRMVILEYTPPGARSTLALVGKGVTFDSGGINLKTTEGIRHMKSDMAGAAAVAAACICAAKLRAEWNIIGLIPLVENMPSGSATRPGDIIRTYSGKTVEVGNTDAEGRLILADALAYAVKRYRPETIIDLATLTGACAVALGQKIAGVFSRDDHLSAAICAAGQKTHERCWRMPLVEEYKEMLESDLADISNMPSKRWGGAITAGLFLAEFVESPRWAHIDIAGPAYATKASAYCGPGGTGFGVRLLVNLLLDLARAMDSQAKTAVKQGRKT